MSPGEEIPKKPEYKISKEDDIFAATLKLLMNIRHIGVDEAAKICEEDIKTASGYEAKPHLILLAEAVRFIKWQQEQQKKQKP